MLTPAGAVGYLIKQGLLDAADVVRGDLQVLDASRRNRNYKLVSRNGPSYLLKQATNPESWAYLANEAHTYQLLHSRAAACAEAGAGSAGRGAVGATGSPLPRLFLFSPERGVLVLELVRHGTRLDDYHRRTGRFPVKVGRLLGEALASVHQLPAEELQSVTDQHALQLNPTWVLSLHIPDLRLYSRISTANIQLIETVQRFPEYCYLLDMLRHEWRQEALIHHDLKWENVLVARSAPGDRLRLTLVDWEFACAGDLSWDVGSVFAAYLDMWVTSISPYPQQAADPLESARYPLRKIQPGMREFWGTYSSIMQLGEQLDERLLRAVRYAGARLLQTTFERCQTAMQLSNADLYSVQLAFNILQRPAEAAVHLLGISA